MKHVNVSTYHYGSDRSSHIIPHGQNIHYQMNIDYYSTLYNTNTTSLTTTIHFHLSLHGPQLEARGASFTLHKTQIHRLKSAQKAIWKGPTESPALVICMSPGLHLIKMNCMNGIVCVSRPAREYRYRVEASTKTVHRTNISPAGSRRGRALGANPLARCARLYIYPGLLNYVHMLNNMNFDHVISQSSFSFVLLVLCEPSGPR